ncbi:MAG: tRNA (N6-isopentenyl adenosine(37)-C2)-methylthiotransferase MiaB, partial [Ruminococcus sp.]|nr:tRNA (N6-isopentenyl adenosine(37)-C2)-methylthiotransferase MiaB [Ruminococcus sp.]
MNDNNQYVVSRLLEHNIKYTTDIGSQPLVYLKSFGCQQNVSDGEKIKGMLSKVGYGFTDSIDNAQV